MKQTVICTRKKGRKKQLDQHGVLPLILFGGLFGTSVLLNFIFWHQTKNDQAVDNKKRKMDNYFKGKWYKGNIFFVFFNGIKKKL